MKICFDCIVLFMGYLCRLVATRSLVLSSPTVSVLYVQEMKLGGTSQERNQYEQLPVFSLFKRDLIVVFAALS